MHRWFRFCAVIALTGFAQGTFAQNTPPSGPKESKSGDEIPLAKHQLKASSSQVLQHTVEQQGKQLEQMSVQIDAQTKQIEAATKQLEELMKRAELQSRQIETLNSDLNRLTAVILTRGNENAPQPQQQPQPTPAQIVAPMHTAAPSVQIAPAVSPAETPVAKAEPALPEPEVTTAPDGSPIHVIKKGENLTSIARQHSTTVAELLKINKIEDERKLQIGQTILLPKPTSH